MDSIKFSHYTSRGHGCGFYSEVIFVNSKALKWAHSRLRNYFSNEAIGQKQPIENRIRDRAKYKSIDSYENHLNNNAHL